MRGYNHNISTVTLFLIIVCHGCGRGNTNRAEVHGTVTLNGEALEQGTISFLPTGQTKGPTAGASIVDGEYSIRTAVGPAIGANRVEIRSARATGEKLPSGEVEVAEIIPAQYNTQSELSTMIEQGTNVADFNLHSK